ncbi:hypothetical protein C8R42DRAFT_642552 [Lentinula raphanica]|nr:hypothetical protein C8R42DRAFT_642552 [Lentinula raphanica]
MHITKSVLPLSFLLWVFSTGVSVSAIPVSSDLKRRADSTLSDKVHEPNLRPRGEPMDVDTVDSVQVILALDESETISQALDRVNRVEILKEVWDAAHLNEKPVLETVLKRLSNVVLNGQRNRAVLKAISALFGPESIYQGKNLAKDSIVLFCRLPRSFSVGGDIHGEEAGELVGREGKPEYAWYKYKIHQVIKDGSPKIELDPIRIGPIVGILCSAMVGVVHGGMVRMVRMVMVRGGMVVRGGLMEGSQRDGDRRSWRDGDRRSRA